MGKKSPKIPAAPDPAATAAAQTASNKETALWQAALNNVNQITPYGTLTYNQTGGGPQYNMNAFNQATQAWQNAVNAGATAQPTSLDGVPTDRYGNRIEGGSSRGSAPLPAMPTLDQFKLADLPPQWTATTALTPEGQKALESAQRIDTATNQLAEQQLGRIADTVSQPLDFSGLPSLTQDFSADRDKVVQAILERNQGSMDRDRAGLETQLTNQGVMRGSKAWQAAIDDLNRGVNDFRLGAIQSGGQEQSRLYGLTADARQRLMQEMLTQRNQPINEMVALLNGGGGVQMPQFASVPQTQLQGTDVVGPINTQYQGQLANFNAKNASNQATQGGLFGLAGSALSGWGAGGFNKFW